LLQIVGHFAVDPWVVIIITPAGQVQFFSFFLLNFQQIHIPLIILLGLRHIFINRKYASPKPPALVADEILVDITLDPLCIESKIINGFLTAFESKVNIFLIFHGRLVFNFYPFYHFFYRKIFLLEY
jgi:hypothetical protein